MNIYLASSWRNKRYPEVLAALRAAGHEVYDFRNPAPGNTGFSWSQIDPDYSEWTEWDIIEALNDHPAARRGFELDMNALDACDACVLLMPCGRSAHLELGYAVGMGKRTMVLLERGIQEADLMWKMADWIEADLGTALDMLRNWEIDLEPEGEEEEQEEASDGIRELAMKRVLRARQTLEWRHGGRHLTPFEWLSLLSEKTGEAAKAANEARFEDHDPGYISPEIVETTALCFEILEDLLRNPPGLEEEEEEEPDYRTIARDIYNVIPDARTMGDFDDIEDWLRGECLDPDAPLTDLAMEYEEARELPSQQ